MTLAGFGILLIALLAFLCAVMLAAWAAQRARRNAGWADVFWTFGTGVAGAMAAFAGGFSLRARC